MEKNIQIFQVGDHVIWKNPEGYIERTSKEMGPFIILDAEFYIPECTCSGLYTPVHSSDCEVSYGPYGGVGHPQIVCIADANGIPVKNEIFGDNTLSRYSGDWFKKVEPT